ncbi:hypothetical protein PoB_005588500 [Plakobranchus ocellatus]|uniref:Copper transporter n=1 Tax=Plakobranchus ocellatus TaxID=259542 RepID=A0AAV4C9J7_9GAST|nr:hypothetical protein PoB_005588500 [Plakobranchus ocellatus]
MIQGTSTAPSQINHVTTITGGSSNHRQPFMDLGNVYREKYSVVTRPEGLYQMLWCRLETVLVYLWVLTQTVCLLVGLTVLHFTTFSAILCYLVNGVIRGRRELLPHKYQ